MKASQRKAIHAKYAKPPLNKTEWQQIVASQKGIVKDQNQHGKYSDILSGNHGGSSFHDVDRTVDARDRLDVKLPKLAKKYGYVPEGYTAYQSWHDSYPPKHFDRK